MKNILEILKGLNIELTDEQQKAVEKEVKENYKTIADYDNQKEKLELAEQQAKDTKKLFEDFKKDFDGVDVKELKGKVETLTNDLATQKSDYEKKIKNIELDSLLNGVSKDKKCIDFEMAKTQLNYEDLLKSSNQKEDAEKAFEELKKTKPYLFEVETKPTKKKGFIPSSNHNDEGETKPLSLKDALKSHYESE